MRGPIDYVVIGFKGNKFNGEILNALSEAVQNGTIAVLDMALVAKDADSKIVSMELSQVDDEVIADFAKDKGVESGLINEEDIAEIGEILEPDTSAGLLVIEQVWAKGLKQAIVNNNGFLIAEGRIHPDAAEEIDKEDK